MSASLGADAARGTSSAEGPASVVHAWVTTVDHKRLGILYIAAGLLFFVVSGVEAIMMRAQLAQAANDLLEPQEFNRLFTMHGTTMVFLVGMPIVTGFGNYLIPLMIGARDMAFPRLNAWGFWMFLFGGLVLYMSYFASMGLYGAGTAPDVGWFAYSPLSGKAFSRGNATDYWILGILISGFGSVSGAINMLTTTLTMRCPGMTMSRLPLFVWMMLVVSFLMLLALPVLTGAQVMLLFDRFLGAHFFDTQAGGDAVLWQHFFWFFGHPEVYILMIPGFAYASEIIPVFSRKVIFGYSFMVAATLAIGLLAVGVWAHHMFTVGMGRGLNIWFAVITMLVGVPTGIKLFNWIATMYGGRIQLRMPMVFCIAFLGQFLIAGLTGILLSGAPLNWQLSDSYFVVAHFHYVLIGGLVFTIFAACYYWFPKMTGRMLSEKIGRWHFWLFFIGFHLTFTTMHVQGILGMPRRIYTYPVERGWEIWNAISSAGAILQGLGVACFLIAVIAAFRRPADAGPDPWNAWTLEWSTSSPPPAYNFLTLPEVRSRRPLWDLKHPDDPDWEHE
ncbi:MAG TPA: cytochrome c oxidase subunit I [Myxococcales bacterium]|nr:cytochrome c oxidase subunit I [Myxococcales bacterium]